MKKKNAVLIVSAVAFVFCVTAVHAEQIFSTWVGPDGGFWSDANNWDPNIVPDNNETNTFAITIDANDVDIWFSQDRMIDYLDVKGDGVEICTDSFHEVSLTLIAPKGLTNYGNLHIGGDGIIDISGQITNADNAKLELWWVEIEGNLYNSTNAKLEFGSHVEIEGEYFQNDGNILIWPTCSEVVIDSVFRNYGQIQSHGSPIFVSTLENSGAIRGYGFVYLEGEFLNNGIIQNEIGGAFHIEARAEDPDNNGIIEANSSGAVTFNYNLTNNPDAMIRLLGGTLSAPTISQKAGATLEGFGGITGDVIIEEDGLIRLTGPTNIVGDVEIGINAVLEISDGITLVTGHVTNNGTIHMKGGRLIPQGGLTNNGNIIWEPGLYNNVADFNLDGHVNINDFADFAGTWLWQAQL